MNSNPAPARADSNELFWRRMRTASTIHKQRKAFWGRKHSDQALDDYDAEYVDEGLTADVEMLRHQIETQGFISAQLAWQEDPPTKSWHPETWYADRKKAAADREREERRWSYGSQRYQDFLDRRASQERERKANEKLKAQMLEKLATMDRTRDAKIGALVFKRREELDTWVMTARPRDWCAVSSNRLSHQVQLLTEDGLVHPFYKRRRGELHGKWRSYSQLLLQRTRLPYPERRFIA